MLGIRPVAGKAMLPWTELLPAMNDVLCPTDHTPAAEAAMSIGSSIAKRLGSSVTLLHVLEKITQSMATPWVHPRRCSPTPKHT